MGKDIKTHNTVKGTIKTLKGTIKALDKTIKAGNTIKETVDRVNYADDAASYNADILESAEKRTVEYAGQKTIQTINASAREAIHVKQRTTTAKESIKASAKSIKEVGTTVKSGAQQIKTAAQSGQAMIKTVRASVKTAQATAETAKASLQAAQKTAQASMRAAKVTAQATVKATKITIKAIIEAIKITSKALIELGEAAFSLIAAGGWVAVVIIVVVILAAVIVSSCLGVFSGAETDGNTLFSVQQELNQEFALEIAEQKKQMTEYETIEVRPADIITEWNNIISVYSVRCQERGLIAAEMTDENIELLRETMWDMVSISQSSEEADIPDTAPPEDEDTEAPTEPEIIGVISVKYMTLDEVASLYHFNDDEREMMFMTLQMATGGNYIGGSGNGRMINPCPDGTFNGNDFPYYPSGGYHAGRDIACPVGTPIYAAADGVVIHINDQAASYGNHIMIAHGNDIYTLYAHNSQLLVSVGDTVKQGQQIAVSGNTGNTTGPHLHFEVRAGGSKYRVNNVDPLEWIG